MLMISSIAFSSLRAALLAVSVASVDCAHYAATQEPGSVMMTFASTVRTRGFAWHTDATVDESRVWILQGCHGKSDEALFERTGRRFDGKCRKAGKPALNRHHVYVSGLEEGKDYSYRLGGKGHYVYGCFSVPRTKNRPLTVVNVNDAQTKDAAKLYQWENTVACAAKAAGGAQDVDFVLSGGDFCDGQFTNVVSQAYESIDRYVQWGIAADTATPRFPGVPWVMASGNHDAKLYGRCTAVDAPAGAPKDCRSFDYGNVHFAVLPYAGGGVSGKVEKTLAWLASDLAAARRAGKTDWSVVCVHWGPYTTGDHGLLDASSDLAFRFGPICASNCVDLVLQAHDHTYSKTLPYRWSGTGCTTNDLDDVAVNLTPRQEGGYDVDPEGTYYVSCGCAGHRVGENAKYASSEGAKSYRNRRCKVVTGRLALDSKYGRKGDGASADLPRQMFGILRIDGLKASYVFFVAEADGTAVPYDELKIAKTRRRKGK